MIMYRFRFLCLYFRNVIYSILLTSVVIICLHVWANKYSVLNDVSPKAFEFMQYKETPTKKISSAKVKHFINKYNHEENIMNLDKFGHLKRDMVIIVIQVHRYRESFKYLLASLCEVIGIEETLLIFSHSYLDDNVNKLIQAIEFCRVMQIFYPYSLQSNAHDFSGYGKKDCSYGMKIKNAEHLNCAGTFTHEEYQRLAKVEKKHFWWWTANKIFFNLSCINNNTGVVIFVEDDLYLMQDFLYMIYYIRNVAKSFPQCEFISTRTDPAMMYDDVYRVEVSTWDPKYHSSVLGFDSSVWNTIVAHYDLFCTVDDSSWSRSLLYLSLNKRWNKMFKVVYSTTPRAIKTSYCSHALLGSCNVLENVLQALTIQKIIKNELFPPYLEVYTKIELENEEFLVFDVVYGGWNDSRDIDLCKNITSNKVFKLLSDMEIQFQDYIIS